MHHFFTERGMRRAICIFACVVGCVSFASAQVPNELPVDNDEQNVQLNRKVQLVMPAREGRIEWSDVASELARSLQLDPATVERIFPNGSLDLRANGTTLALLGIDLALGDAVSIDMVQDQAGHPALRLTYDRDGIRFLATKRRPKPARIDLDEDWPKRTAKLPLVLCLHGLKGDPDQFDGFRAFLRRSGFATAAVSYDDQQAVRTSAQQVAEICNQLFKDEQTPKFFLVGHSMGGLVAREWIESPDLGDERIVGLITAGSPHRGSGWASMPPLLDLFAEGRFGINDIIDVILHQSSSPGMHDLMPGSEFLTTLNGRPRRPGVQYTAIVGTGSPLTEDNVAKIRSVLQKANAKSATVRLLQPRIQPLLQGFDELARGKGDGVVATKRGTIDGVKDVLVFEVSHGEYFRASGQPIWDEILRRLVLSGES